MDLRPLIEIGLQPVDLDRTMGQAVSKVTGLGKLDFSPYDPAPMKHPLVIARPEQGELAIQIQTR